jgi:hypothetical protein
MKDYMGSIASPTIPSPSQIGKVGVVVSTLIQVVRATHPLTSSLIGRGNRGFALVIVCLFLLSACETQTVIYKDVPEYQLRQGIVPERVVLEDGTILIHRPRQLRGVVASTSAGATESGEPAEEGAQGSGPTLMPEQIFTAILFALREGTYENVWDNVLSRQVKERYGDGDAGFDEFSAYMERNRDDLYSMINRLTVSIYSPEVIQEQTPSGGLRYRFHNTVADQFKFAAVDLVYEDYGLKLYAIHPR